MTRSSKGPWSTSLEARLFVRTKRSPSTFALRVTSNADVSLWMEMFTIHQVLWKEVSSRPRIPSCYKPRRLKGFLMRTKRFSKRRISCCSRFRRMTGFWVRLRKTWMKSGRSRVRSEPISNRSKGWKMVWVRTWNLFWRGNLRVVRKNWKNFRIFLRNSKLMKRSWNRFQVPKGMMRILISTLLSRLRKEKRNLLSWRQLIMSLLRRLVKAVLIRRKRFRERSNFWRKKSRFRRGLRLMRIIWVSSRRSFRVWSRPSSNKSKKFRSWFSRERSWIIKRLNCMRFWRVWKPRKRKTTQNWLMC